MLPDFIFVKKIVIKNLNKYLQQKSRNKDAFLREIPEIIQHEGDAWRAKTLDGFETQSKFKAFSSKYEIKNKDIIEKGKKAFEEKIDEVVDDIIKQKSKILFKKIDKITSKTGNKFKGPLTKKKFLSMLKKIEFSFDSEGNLQDFTIVAGANTRKKLMKKFQKWEKDLKFNKKYELIIQKKREKWNDRQNNRKLVA